MYSVIPGNFFLCRWRRGTARVLGLYIRLFPIMDKQLSFGVERDILVDELQYYFEQTQAADGNTTLIVRNCE